MVIEHTFVTTLGPTEAGAMAAALLGKAGFVDRGVASPGDTEERGDFEMVRATVGQSGVIATVPCPQKVRMDYDRGRVVLAASISPVVRGQEPSPSSPAAQPYADLMIALAEALEQTLVDRKPVDDAIERWKTLDGVIPQRARTRKPVRRTITYACAGIIVLSIISGTFKRAGSFALLASPNPTLSFPANEDARDEAPAERGSFSDMRIEQLRVEADAVLRNKNVQAANDVAALFALGDRYWQAKHREKALQLYASGLKRAPSDYSRRLAYANMLSRQDKCPAAIDQAQIVLNECEDVALLAKARTFIGDDAEDIAPLSALAGEKPILVLVPMGDADLLLLQSEQKKLQDDLGIEVQLRSAAMNFPVAARNPLQQSADAVRAQLEKVRKDKPEVYDAILREAGVTRAELADNAKAVNIGAYILRRLQQTDTAWKLESIGSHDDTQWFAPGMTEGFAAVVHPFRKKNVRFIGITRSDISGENGAYVFSWWADDCAVISYRRFTARFNKDAPNRARLLRRLHLQALTSAAEIFGVPACTDPACARGNANNLEDLDAKSDKICQACRKEFAKAFSR